MQTQRTTDDPVTAVSKTQGNLPDLALVTNLNGAAGSLPNRVPKSKRWSRRGQLLAGAGVALLIAGAGVAYLLARDPFHAKRTDLVTHRVSKERLELTIIERGALESAKNSDVYCTVKASQKGGTVASTIKWVIDDGSSVKKRDLLVDLDDSGLQDQLKNEKITLDKNEADKINKDENYKIQLSQNESDIKTAEVNLELAEIDLQKYKEGDYPQQLKIFEGNIKQAESDLEQQRDRVAWANRMLKKGYYTVTQTQGEQSKLENLEILLAKASEDRRVLTDPTYGTGKRENTDRANKVAEAKRALERVNSQAKAKEVQARSDRDSTKSVYQQQQARCKEIEDEIKKCKIYAPQDGMVVYYVPEQARGGGGSQQSIVAQGEPVREGQKLMQIPDLRQMLANTKVHEALVARVRQGQPATIRVDSFPDRQLRAHVDYVATISSQQDFWAPDVKVYTTKVLIDEPVEGLKPGMSAGVTIIVADALKDVLTVPLQAIVGSAEMGKQRKCFVMTPQGPVERTILIGQSNDRMAEIREGLKEGDEVVENPQALVGDAVKTRQARGKEKVDFEAGKPSDSGKARPQGSAGPEKRPEAGKGDGPPGGGGAQLSPEERQKKMQERLEQFRKASPEQRKQMLEQVPEAFRDKLKEQLKAQGVEVK